MGVRFSFSVHGVSTELIFLEGGNEKGCRGGQPVGAE